MEIKLSAPQKQLLELAKEKGFLMINDFVVAYAHKLTRESAIDRFVQLGYLKESITAGKFDYIGGKK